MSVATSVYSPTFRLCPSTPINRRSRQAERSPIFSSSLLAPLAPVPIGLVRPPFAPSPPQAPRIPLLGYFGARRVVKGFARLPAAITAAAARWSDVRAFIQCYRHPQDESDPATESALAALRAMPAVELLDTTLAPEDYQKWFDRCAAVLIPYDARHYRAGTSGIFVEAVASGSAVLTTTGSWMAKEAKRFGLTRVFACDWTVYEATGALVVRALRIGLEPWRPTLGECDWIAAHAPAALLARLVAERQ